MKKNLVLISVAAMTAFVVSACSGVDGDELGSSQEDNVESTSEALTSGKLYGSDTLKGAISGAAALAPNPKIVYEGKGTGVGEACLRNPKAISSATGFCTGTGPNGTLAYQTLAPMSRAFKNTGTNTCSGGTTSPAANGCCANERTNVIALDGVDIFVASVSSQTNITSASAKTLFAGNGNGTSTTFPTGCPASVTGFDLTKRYRRNDASGTTDTFKSLLAIADTKNFRSFCPGVISVDDALSTSVKPVGTRWTSAGVAQGVTLSACANGDSATTCIGKLTASGTATLTPVGYSGNSAARTGNKRLSVDGVASNATNIRNLLTNTAPVYPLARRVYLNENTVETSGAEETAFYRWVYGTDANGTGNNKAAFEAQLTAQGFISCSSSGALQCGVGVCKNSSNVALNDGRGASAVVGGTDVACKATARCVR